jgi:hypothetical protein
VMSKAEELDLKHGRLLTSHFCDAHGCMFGNGIGTLPRQTSKGICRGDVDDYAATDIARAVPTSPCFRRLLTHSRNLCAHTKKISSGVDAHNAIKVFDVSFGQGRMCTIVDLEDGT